MGDGDERDREGRDREGLDPIVLVPELVLYLLRHGRRPQRDAELAYPL